MVSICFSVCTFVLVALSSLNAQTTASASSAKPAGSGFLNPTNPEAAPNASKTAPPPVLTPEMRGDILMARKMFREAAEVYAEGPGDSAVLANKTGIAFHQMMALEVARKHYDRAIRLNPHYAEAVNNLGTVFYARKNYRRAVSLYNRALKLTPTSASIMSNLGTAQFARKKYKECFEAYQRALEIDPEVFEHRSSQGVLLQERSVEERAKFHYYLAKTYAKAGNTERALAYMRKAIEEGFKDRQKFREDPEFARMQNDPEFLELLVLEPRVL
jgi:tetratricopeptide (TPR) repeat protein